MGGTFLVVAVIYFTAIAGISAWGFFKTRTEVDFIAAGRTIGPIVGGAVLTATQISAGTFVGTVGRHYVAGVSWWYIWFGVWAGWLVSAFFVAPKLRRFGALTVPDYVATRFGSTGAGSLAGVAAPARKSSTAPAGVRVGTKGTTTGSRSTPPLTR